MAAACQNRNPRAPAASMSAQEQPIPHVDVEEEDVDLHVYGTNDTSTSWAEEVNIEPASIIADIHEVLESTIPMNHQTEEVVCLEATPSVEGCSEIQEN